MFNFFKSDAVRALFSVAGALMLSSTMIVAAVGPARAAVPQQSTAVHAAAPLAY